MSNINIDILVRKNVFDMNSYSSARDEFENKKENLVFLDANESPFKMISIDTQTINILI